DTPNQGPATLQLEFVGLQGNDPNGILRNPDVAFNAVTNPFVGFLVRNELLTLNGTGFGGQGALENVAGNNTWGNAITLGSPPPTNGTTVLINVDSVTTGTPPNTTTTNTELTLSGVVGDPNGVFNLTKGGPGTLILSNANTYRGLTSVNAG